MIIGVDALIKSIIVALDKTLKDENLSRVRYIHIYNNILEITNSVFLFRYNTDKIDGLISNIDVDKDYYIEIEKLKNFKNINSMVLEKDCFFVNDIRIEYSQTETYPFTDKLFKDEYDGIDRYIDLSLEAVETLCKTMKAFKNKNVILRLYDNHSFPSHISRMILFSFYDKDFSISNGVFMSCRSSQKEFFKDFVLKIKQTNKEEK